MPLHKWKAELSWLFHSFHMGWMVNLSGALNEKLSSDHYAILERNISPLEDGRFVSGVMEPPEPEESDEEYYSRKKNVVTIRRTEADEVVAAIIVLVPGDKSSATCCKNLVDKASGLLRRGINLLMVDLFPTTPHATGNVHSLVWNKATDSEMIVANGFARVAASYECIDGDVQAYVEPLALGDPLPSMPVFLKPGGCLMLPLESTYASAYEKVPARWRRVIEA